MRFLSLKTLVTADIPLMSDKGKTEFLDTVGFLLSEKIRTNALKKHRTSKFWQSIADKSKNGYDVDNNRVTAGNSHHAALHKQIGGWIKAPGQGEGAKKRQWLTIPVGKAREQKKEWQDFPEQSTVFRKFGKSLALIFEVKSWKTATKGKHEGELVPDELGEVLFVCKKAVFQKGEYWFPTEADIKEIIDRTIKRMMRK